MLDNDFKKKGNALKHPFYLSSAYSATKPDKHCAVSRSRKRFYHIYV